MTAATCKTCPWYDANLNGHCGECRARSPRLVLSENDNTAVFPLMADTEWCGEHPDRRPTEYLAAATL